MIGGSIACLKLIITSNVIEIILLSQVSTIVAHEAMITIISTLCAPYISKNDT